MSDSKSESSRRRDIRKPVQQRSTARVHKVLEAAERMLGEVGPEKTSIPALAEVTGVPRHAIYPFFPDKYALFSHLAQRHMEALAKALIASKAADRARTWQAWVEAAIKVAAEYYNAHPAASALLLRGSFADSDSDSEAHEAKNVAIGSLLRAKAASLNVLERLPMSPDAATIGVEIAFACFRHGYAREGTLSPAIRREAGRAVTAYLSSWD